MRNPFGYSITGRLRLYGLTVLVPLFVLAGVILYHYWVVMPEEALDKARRESREWSLMMDDFFARTRSVLLTVSNLPQVTNARPEEATPLLRELAAVYPEYKSFFVADAGGRVWASTDSGGVGIQMSDRAFFQDALSSGELTTSGVVASRVTGLPSVVAAFPLPRKDNQPGGVVATSFEMDELPNILAGLHPGQHYRVTVFDKEGKLVFQAGPLDAAGNVNTRCDTCHNAPAPSGDMTHRAWIGNDQFHALATTSLGWHVIFNAPADDVLGSARRDAWLTLFLVVVMLAASLLVANLSGRRLSRPLLRLAGAARRFGAGGIVDPLEVTTKDEVGILTQSFNAMISEIGDRRFHQDRQRAQLNTLRELDRAMSSTLSLPAVLDILANEVHGIGAVDALAIYLLDDESVLDVVTNRGISRILPGADSKDRCENLARRALETNTYVSIEPMRDQQSSEAPTPRGELLAAPLASKGRPLGAILFGTSREGGFAAEEREFLLGVALQASTAVENARLYGLEHRRVAELEVLSDEMKRQRDELRRAQDSIVDTLTLALQAKDPYTMGHAERVERLARRIASRMSLSREKQEVLARAARLHDIGKISIPEYLLRKSGPLTPPERTQFELHPERSAELLRHVADLDQVLPAIRGHHEHFDGRGYPDGLAGEEIPLEARVIAVADAYDALTTDRPYRSALSHEEALTVLLANAGSQWDANLVQILVKSFEEGDPTDQAGRVSLGQGIPQQG